MFMSIFSHLRKWGTNYSDWPFVHILLLLLSIIILSSHEVAAQERTEVTDASSSIKKHTVLSILIIFLLFFSFPSFLRADSIDLPRTGQITCYDMSGAMIPCSG